MTFRMISLHVLALVVGLAMLASTPALAQSGRLYVATDVGVFVPATDQQIVRVTIGNPNQPDAGRDGNLQISDLTGVAIDPVTIGPGESFTYTLDPRETGVLVDATTGLRHVRVSGRITAVVSDPSDKAPQPALTIEILNRRNGQLASFLAFPGFAGAMMR